MVLFNDGWFLIITRLSFTFSKNHMFSRVNILDAEWLQNSEWSPTEIFLDIIFFLGDCWYTNMFTYS